MKHDLPASYYGYGWIASANFAGYLLGNLALLAWVRRIRRPLLVNAISFLAMSLTDVAIGLSSDLTGVVIWRFVNGFAQASVLVLTVTLTLDTVPVALRGRISGITWMGGALGVTLCGAAAPLTLGTHPAITWRNEWIAMGIASLVVIPGFWISVVRAGRSPHATPGAGASVGLLPFGLLCLIYASFGAAFIELFTYYSAFARGLGIQREYLGFAWALAGVCGMAGAVLWGRAFDRRQSPGIAALPMMVAAFGVLLIATGRRELVVIGGIIAVSSTFGFAAVFAAVARKLISSTAFPTMFTIATIAFALGQIGGAPIGGALSDRFSLGAAMLGAAAAFLIGALLAGLLAVATRRAAVVDHAVGERDEAPAIALAR